MATYVALTTTNAQSGWELLAERTTRDAAWRAGEDALDRRYGLPCDRAHDIYEDTERKNLTVLSLTTALRRGVLSRFQWENRYEVPA